MTKTHHQERNNQQKTPASPCVGSPPHLTWGSSRFPPRHHRCRRCCEPRPLPPLPPPRRCSSRRRRCRRRYRCRLVCPLRLWRGTWHEFRPVQLRPDPTGASHPGRQLGWDGVVALGRVRVLVMVYLIVMTATIQQSLDYRARRPQGVNWFVVPGGNERKHVMIARLTKRQQRVKSPTTLNYCPLFLTT